MEEWRSIAGFEGIYEVSNYGNVRSLDRLTKRGKLRKGQPLKGIIKSGRYKFVRLCKPGVQRTANIHRLVAEAFLPNPNNYPFVRHGDHNKLNNHVDNLQWGTRLDNIADGIAGSTNAHGNYTHCARGHEFIEGNVPPSNKSRACRSCALARGRLGDRPELKDTYTLQSLADIYFRAISDGYNFNRSNARFSDMINLYGKEELANSQRLAPGGIRNFESRSQ